MSKPVPTLPVETDQLILVPLDSVPYEVPLDYPIYLKVNDRFVLFRNPGDVLTKDRVGQLADKSVEAVYVRREDINGYIETLKAALDEVGITSGSESAAMGLRHLIFSYWRLMEERREVDKTLFGTLIEQVGKMPVAIAKNRELSIKLLRRYQDPSVYYSNNSVNVSLYSVAIGLKLGYSIEKLQELAIAGCVANIGILKVPREILYKPGPLTPEELEIARSHCTRGGEILKLLFVPDCITDVALHHHEWVNGKGYPEGISGDAISPYARIVSIAESYNALTSHRPWAGPVLPSHAVEMMGQTVGKFDPKILGISLKA